MAGAVSTCGLCYTVAMINRSPSESANALVQAFERDVLPAYTAESVLVTFCALPEAYNAVAWRAPGQPPLIMLRPRDCDGAALLHDLLHELAHVLLHSFPRPRWARVGECESEAHRQARRDYGRQEDEADAWADRELPRWLPLLAPVRP